MGRTPVGRVTRHPAPPREISSREVVAPPYPASTLDTIIHERVRLGIVSALALNASLTFTELKRMLGLTDGNLSVHARRLEEVGYVACDKAFNGRTPRTEYRLTPAGRRALDRYLEQMDEIIRATRASLYSRAL